MLIFIAVMTSILVYGSYRCIKEKSLSYFRWFINFLRYTFFKGNKKISAIFWATLTSSVGLSNLLGHKNINFSVFNPVSHFLFGFLSRELLLIANDYHPFIDKIASKFPDRISRYVNPTAFAFMLCMGNGIQEEIQKMIPFLKSLVWTNLPDQIVDAVMDTAGIMLSAKRCSVFTRLKEAINKN
ncbi:MAG: hypothetical protein H5T74_10930 [Actinobacteria bacterium]|nr:hypothetical protein [Actinomycetota bacterium]